MRVAILVAALSLGCATTHFPAAPSEQTVAAIIMNECAKISVWAVVVYESEDRLVDGKPYGYPGQMLPAAMGARRPNTVVVYPAAFEVAHDRLVKYAQHECCHLFLNHTMTPERTEEAEAEACVRERY